MTRPRQILYLLLGCFFVLVVLVSILVLVSIQFTRSTTTVVPIVLDLLSFTLLVIAVSSLARRRTRSSRFRRPVSQQKR